MPSQTATARSPDLPLDPLIEEAYRELENSREIARTILVNARHEASQIVDRARKEARKISEEAERESSVARSQQATEATRIEQEAYDRGFGEGVRQGEQEGRQSFDTLIGRLQSIAEYLGRQRREMIRENRQEVVELILRISERVLAIETSSRKDLLAANIALVLEDLTSDELVHIHLNPDDFTAIRNQLARGDAPACRPQFHEDSSVPAGECRIRSQSLNMDVSFQKRFQEIRDRLLASVEHAGREG